VPEPLPQAEATTGDGAGGMAAPALTFVGGYGSSRAEQSSQSDEPGEQTGRATATAATT
jgi:hypothetical protein